MLGNLPEVTALGGPATAHAVYARRYGPLWTSYGGPVPLVMTDHPEYARRVLQARHFLNAAPSCCLSPVLSDLTASVSIDGAHALSCLALLGIAKTVPVIGRAPYGGQHMQCATLSMATSQELKCEICCHVCRNSPCAQERASLQHSNAGA